MGRGTPIEAALLGSSLPPTLGGGGLGSSEGSLGGPPAGGGGDLSFTSGGGGGGGASEIMQAAFKTLNRPASAPAVPAGGFGFHMPNPARLTGSLTSLQGWTTLGPFSGPVVIMPINVVTAGPLLAFPGNPPRDALEELMAIRSRGNGVLYLPFGGLWSVKYLQTGSINVAIQDARNPSFLAWLMQSVNGASAILSWTSTALTVAPVTVIAANPYRTALGIAVVEGTGVVNFGATADYVAGVSIAGFTMGATYGPLFLTDEILVRSAISARTTAGAGLISVCEWID